MKQIKIDMIDMSKVHLHHLSREMGFVKRGKLVDIFVVSKKAIGLLLK